MATLLELAKIKHHAVRSDGAKFLDGERNDALDTSWLTVNSSGRVTLGPGLYDELLVVKGEVSDDQIKAWASMGAPFYDPTPVIPDSQIPSAGEWSSKNKTFFQTDPPVGAVVGDLWVDTDDNDRLYRWDGATWVDITDKSPIDAEKKPVYVKGAGADIDIDKYGIRATRKADGKKTFEIDAETGDAYFKGDITGASGKFGATEVGDLGVLVRDLVSQELRLHLGDVSGRPWGENDAPLPANRYGIWGDRAGLYLRGYASLIAFGTCEDEEIITIPEGVAVNPKVFIALKHFLTYRPGATFDSEDRVYVLSDALRISDTEWKAKIKVLREGDEDLWDPLSLTTGTWTLTRPNQLFEGKRGVYTDYIICRPRYSIGILPVLGGSVTLRMRITNEFNANGDPINWRTVETFSTSTNGSSGTLNWDKSVPYGQWAVELRGEASNPPFTSKAQTGISRWGYRIGTQYLDAKGNTIGGTDPASEPSGMSAMYFVIDQG